MRVNWSLLFSIKGGQANRDHQPCVKTLLLQLNCFKTSITLLLSFLADRGGLVALGPWEKNLQHKPIEKLTYVLILILLFVLSDE